MKWRHGLLAGLAGLAWSTSAWAQGGETSPRAAGGPLEALIGLACCFVMVALVVGGIVGVIYLVRKSGGSSAPSAPPGPVSIAGATTVTKAGVRFDLPRSWSAKANSLAIGDQVLITGQPLSFFVMQWMPGAKTYRDTFESEMKKKLETGADLTPEQHANLKENLSGDGLQRMVEAAVRGYAQGQMQGVAKVSIEAAGGGSDPKFAEDPTDDGKIAGRAAKLVPFDSKKGSRSFTGEGRWIAVDDYYLYLVWMAPTQFAKDCEPGIDLVLKSLSVVAAPR